MALRNALLFIKSERKLYVFLTMALNSKEHLCKGATSVRERLINLNSSSSGFITY